MEFYLVGFLVRGATKVSDLTSPAFAEVEATIFLGAFFLSSVQQAAEVLRRCLWCLGDGIFCRSRPRYAGKGTRIESMYFLLNMGLFICHVSLPQGSYVKMTEVKLFFLVAGEVVGEVVEV